jgi:riboflavin kinase/FMN adenylyltransferase
VSVGVNPTTDRDNVRKVEAFLMDGFAGDLYGQAFALDFRTKIRDEQKFDGLDALVVQMGRDIAHINEVLTVPLDTKTA